MRLLSQNGQHVERVGERKKLSESLPTEHGEKQAANRTRSQEQQDERKCAKKVASHTPMNQHTLK